MVAQRTGSVTGEDSIPCHICGIRGVGALAFTTKGYAGASSAVSRKFVALTEHALADLHGADLTGLDQVGQVGPDERPTM